MLKKYTLSEKWLFVGMLLVSVLFIVNVFSRLTPFDLDNIFLNSDALYLPSLYKDLFIDGSGLKDWNFGPSPGYFPDMLFYFILMFIFNDFLVASFMFPIIQYLAIIFIFSLMLKQIIPANSKIYASVSALLMLSFFCVSIYSDDFKFTFFLISNAFHNGAFVMTLLCVALTLHFLKVGKKSNLILIAISSILAVLSDRLFIIMYLVPFIAISTLYMFLGQRKKFKPLLITNIIGLVVGLVLFKAIIQIAYIYFASPHKLLDIGNSISSLTMMFKQIWAYILQFNFITLIIILSLMSFAGHCIYLFNDLVKKKNRDDSITTVYSMFSILFSIFVFGAPILSGSYTGWDTLRYNIGFYYLSILNLSFVLYLFSQKKGYRFFNILILKRITLVLAVVALIAGISSFSSTGLKKYFSYYPKSVEEVDNLAEKHDLKMGVGNYWIAKHATMFSKTGLIIHPVFDHIEPHYHACNENWFYADNAVYDFIVLNRLADREAYKKIFGDGTPISDDEYLRVIKVEPFKFDRKTHMPYFIDSTD